MCIYVYIHMFVRNFIHLYRYILYINYMHYVSSCVYLFIILVPGVSQYIYASWYGFI